MPLLVLLAQGSGHVAQLLRTPAGEHHLRLPLAEREEELRDAGGGHRPGEVRGGELAGCQDALRSPLVDHRTAHGTHVPVATTPLAPLVHRVAPADAAEAYLAVAAPSRNAV